MTNSTLPPPHPVASASQPTSAPPKHDQNPIFTTPTPAQRNLEVLKQHFPSALEISPEGHYTINAAKLQMALDPAGVKVEEDGFELRWVGKREAYHSAFTPGQKIVAPLRGDSKNWDTTGNLLLRGDNLDALRLLRHSYFGKVKLIYIDPPYNTQSDAFIYNDNFGASQTQVLEQLGYDKENIDYIKNIYGARTHSGWLSFMYPRLLLAKDLLSEDGVIFISIDDNEQAQLKLLCDEVFGQDNFVANLVWQKKYGPANDAKGISSTHEYVLAYAKNNLNWTPNFAPRDEKQLTAFKNPDNDPRGVWRASDLSARTYSKSGDYEITGLNGEKFRPPPSRAWIVNEKRFKELLSDNRITFGVSGDGRPMQKKFLTEVNDGIAPETWWSRDKAGDNKIARYELKAHFPENIFETPKPTKLISEIIKLATTNDDLILDFFAGSGTTGEAVMRLNAEDGGNRRFILVQIPQAIDPKRQKEAHQFVTQELGKPATIFEITAERLRRAGAKIEAEQAQKPPPDEKSSKKNQKTDAPQANLDKASSDAVPASLMDTGFRAFDLVEDEDALILHKPLHEATQADLLHFEAASNAASPKQNAATRQRVLHNLLLAEGLPLTTHITEVIAGTLYQAADVAIFLAAVDAITLADTLGELKQAATPPLYLTLYAPWIKDDNFLQNIKTRAHTLGYSAEKLRLRG